MVRSGSNIRRCKNCGMYFAVVNRKVAYCDRNTGGEACSAIGRKSSFQKKMDGEYPLKVYNRAYKTHHARVRNGIMGQADFLKWCDEAKEKLGKVRSGELDPVAFEEWLKK